MPKLELTNDFWFMVDVEPTGCWSWTDRKDPKGYGRFSRVWVDATTAFVHRLAYMAIIGPIPDDLPLDHLCRNRACCNPSHLEPVSAGVNVLRGESLAARNAAATECVHGHPFTSENTYITPDGRRNCRKCRAEASARCYRRRAG